MNVLGLELDPRGVALLANPMFIMSAFSFPLLIFVVFAVSELAEPVERLARRSVRLARFIDRAREVGPHEGWSGYIVSAVVVAFLFGFAAWAFTTLRSS